MTNRNYELETVNYRKAPSALLIIAIICASILVSIFMITRNKEVKYVPSTINPVQKLEEKEIIKKDTTPAIGKASVSLIAMDPFSCHNVFTNGYTTDAFGKSYATNLYPDTGFHESTCTIEYYLDGQYNSFEATKYATEYAYDSDTNCAIKIEVDGKVQYYDQGYSKKDKAECIQLDVTNADFLTITFIEDWCTEGKGMSYPAIALADAYLYYAN